MRRARAVAVAAALFSLAAPGAASALTPSVAERPVFSLLQPYGVQPYGVVAGPDGALWFTESSGSRIGRLTTSGFLATFPVPSGSATQWDIAVGPDGNTWFAEDTGNRIARVTPGGAITEFAVPTANSSPRGIIAGPDGNLWFTEAAVGKVGRITPAGTITEFRLSSAASAPVGITAGPDGNLWAAESGADKLARITPDGVLTEFVLPTAGAGVYDVAAGPDGNVWFAERAAGKVGRITRDGTISEYALAPSSTQPLAIVAGPDDALWFTEVASNTIGRITTSGAISRYPVPTPMASLASITRGPDGNMWFTEAGANAVARISTPPAVGPAAPQALQGTTAVIAAVADPHAQATTMRVEYGPTDAYGTTTPETSLTSGGGQQTVPLTLDGLTPGQTYHFRSVATNPTGTSYGPDRTFDTPSDTPAGAAPAALELPSPAGPGPGPLPLASGADRPLAMISETVVTVRRDGRAPIPITCSAAAVEGCRGKVVLRLAPAKVKRHPKHAARGVAARCARGCRPLGQATFEAKSGKTKRVPVHLSTSGRRMLAAAGKLTVVATVTVTDHGRTAVSSRRVEVRARA